VSDDDGDVVHVVEGGSALRAGERVHGVIDWTRRFDHMQQHTGQHILSAAIIRTFGVASVSVHLGADVSTVDLARELTTEQLNAAEDAANAVVWENRPITIRYADADEAKDLPLRKTPKRDGTLRLIDIADWDLSACGGTHVASTASVGIIVVSGWERFKGGQRVTFLCGGRAMRGFRQLRDATGAAARLLSTTVEAIPVAIERLQTEQRDQTRAIAALERDLAGHRAKQLQGEADTCPSGRAVVGVVDASPQALKDLATAVCALPGFVAVLIESDTPSRIVVTRSTDVAVSAASIVASLTSQFGGRGGGKPDLAQAGGLNGAPQAIADAARRLLRETSA
jgi:alanyl-tRNA synthetase